MNLSESQVPLAQAFDLALVDLDGTAYRGHSRIAFAAEALNAARSSQRIVYVTNNASRTQASVAGQLREMDIRVEDADVLTAAIAGAVMLHEVVEVGAPVLTIGGAGLIEAVRNEGFVPVLSAQDNPAAVIQGYDSSVGWKGLAEATYAICQGVPYIATNLDLTLPTERGFAPGNGSLVAAVVAATNVTPRSPGKPAATMFELATQQTCSHRPLVVGDRLNTDIAGGHVAGYPSMHVLTGVNSGRDVVLAIESERPSFLATDLRGLLQPHPIPRHEGEWWVLGDTAARVVAGKLELTRPPVTLNALRVAAVACWNAETIDVDTVPEFMVNNE